MAPAVTFCFQFLRDNLSSPSAVFSSYTHIPYTESVGGGGVGGSERSTECGQKRRNVYLRHLFYFSAKKINCLLFLSNS